MSDYKDDIQTIFDNICIERFDKNYWELPVDVQDTLYREAEQLYMDRAAARSDYVRKAQREGAI